MDTFKVANKSKCLCHRESPLSISSNVLILTNFVYLYFFYFKIAHAHSQIEQKVQPLKLVTPWLSGFSHVRAPSLCLLEDHWLILPVLHKSEGLFCI